MFTLHNGDCLQVLPSIPSGSIDAIITDLPYGTTACAWDEVIPFADMWREVKRVLKPSGSFVTTASQPFTSALIMSNPSDFSHQWIWNKGIAPNPLLSKKMPMKNFEEVLVFYQQYDDTFTDWRREYFKNVFEFIGTTKKKIVDELGQEFDHCFRFGSRQFSIPTFESYGVLVNRFEINQMKGYKEYSEIENTPKTYNPQMVIRGNPVKKGFKGKLKAGGFLGDIEIDTRAFNNSYYPLAILDIPQKRDKLHPTQKPVALYEYLIKTYTNEGENVLDIAMGSGTTIEAAERTGRNSIGIEKDEGIFQSAVLRLKSFTPSNKACSGRVDSSGSPELFPAEISPSEKVTRQSTRR